MIWEEWKQIYLEIVREFNYSTSEDLRAAKILNNLIGSRACSIRYLRKVLRNKYLIVVFGAGPSLEFDLEEFLEAGISEKSVVVAVDGASRLFLERGLGVDIVVTDLDGGDEVLLNISKKCSVMIVHAHGDNIGKILSIVPGLSCRILGTTQCEPFGRLYNFGGFTDGDRAVFLSDKLPQETIVLAGMDFGEEIGRYSKNTTELDQSRLEMKRKKLRVGKRLLEFYASRSTKKLYNVTRHGEEIKGFRRTSFKELAKLL